MPTHTFTAAVPALMRPAHDDLTACPVVLGEVACACGFGDHDTRGGDPAAFLTRSLRHLQLHHPDVLDHPGEEHAERG